MTQHCTENIAAACNIFYPAQNLTNMAMVLAAYTASLCLQNICCALISSVNSQNAHEANLRASATWSRDTIAGFAGAVSSRDAVVSKLTC